MYKWFVFPCACVCVILPYVCMTNNCIDFNLGGAYPPDVGHTAWLQRHSSVTIGEKSQSKHYGQGWFVFACVDHVITAHCVYRPVAGRHCTWLIKKAMWR